MEALPRAEYLKSPVAYGCDVLIGVCVASGVELELKIHLFVFVAFVVGRVCRLAACRSLPESEIHVRCRQRNRFAVPHKVAAQFEAFLAKEVEIGNKIWAQFDVVTGRVNHKSILRPIIVGLTHKDFARAHIGAVVPRVYNIACQHSAIDAVDIGFLYACPQLRVVLRDFVRNAVGTLNLYRYIVAAVAAFLYVGYLYAGVSIQEILHFGHLRLIFLGGPAQRQCDSTGRRAGRLADAGCQGGERSFYPFLVVHLLGELAGGEQVVKMRNVFGKQLLNHRFRPVAHHTFRARCSA